MTKYNFSSMNTCVCMILISIENVESCHVTKDAGNVLFTLCNGRMLPIKLLAIYTFALTAEIQSMD